MEHACILLLRPHIMIITLASLYVLGIILRIIYYKVFHPNCDMKKIEELNEPVKTARAAACIHLVETDSAEEDSPGAPTRIQPVTGAQKRMRTMAANFYL